MEKIALIAVLLILIAATSPNVVASHVIYVKCPFQDSIDCPSLSLQEPSHNYVSEKSISLELYNLGKGDMSVIKISAASEALGGNAENANLGCGCTFSPAEPALLRAEGNTKITFILDIPDANCPDWCNYRITGRDENMYNLTVFYSWADTPNVIHQSQGEMMERLDERSGFDKIRDSLFIIIIDRIKPLLWMSVAGLILYVLGAMFIARKAKKKDKPKLIWLLTGLAAALVYLPVFAKYFLAPCLVVEDSLELLVLATLVAFPFLSGAITARLTKSKWQWVWMGALFLIFLIAPIFYFGVLC